MRTNLELFALSLLIIIPICLIFLYTMHLINSKRGEFSRHHIRAIFLNAVSVTLFFTIPLNIRYGTLIKNLDKSINTLAVENWNPITTQIALIVTNIISPTNMFILTVSFGALLLLHKKCKHAILLLVSLGGGLLFEVLTKIIVHRERPVNALLTLSDYSFPSGHATMSTIFFIMVIYTYKDKITSRGLRYLFIGTNAALFFLIGLSRVYLRVHWLSDVFAGFALGIFWLTLLILVSYFIPKKYYGCLRLR